MFFAVFFQVAPLLAGKVCVCTQNPFFHNFLGSASCKWVYPSLWGFITIVVAIFCNHSCAPRNTMWFTTTPWTSPMRSATPWAWESCLARRHTQKNARDCRKCVSWSGNTWWLIPLSKWLITPVINGICVGLIHWNHWGYIPLTKWVVRHQVPFKEILFRRLDPQLASVVWD